MTQSDEHVLTASELLNIIRHSIRQQMYGLMNPLEKMEPRLNFQ